MVREGPAAPRASLDRSTLRISFERSRQAPSLARAAIIGFSEGSDLPPESLDILALLVSELVSNAVLHSDASEASEIELCARQLGQDAMRVEVIDQGSGFTPTPRDPSQPDAGYGLHLVEMQTTRWGVDRRGGTRVWFELGAAS
jgi:anti-sigma regulatory factor (Ser/Thr protein kinase)